MLHSFGYLMCQRKRGNASLRIFTSGESYVKSGWGVSVNTSCLTIRPNKAETQMEGSACSLCAVWLRGVPHHEASTRCVDNRAKQSLEVRLKRFPLDAV